MKHSITYASWVATIATGFCLFCTVGCVKQKTTPATASEADSLKEPTFQSTDTTLTEPTSSLEEQLDAITRADDPRSKETHVSSYYDRGYKQGYNDGFEDGVENTRFESFDDACDVTTHSKAIDYKNGYQEGYDVGYDDGFADSDFTPDDDFEE